MTLQAIWLSELKMGAAKKKRFLEHFSSIEDLYSATESDYRQSGLFSHTDIEKLKRKSLKDAEKILEKCYIEGIRTISIEDDEYPERLANIDDAPIVLYYKGNLPSFDTELAIAMVGPRRNTAYGKMAAERLAYELSSCGAHIVSGLALGVDALAHTGALLAGGTTTAVLGCGPDIIYPKTNTNLYEEICVRGCIISEYPPGTPPERFHFPARNRIVSGLSVGVLVIEADKKSGSLITAKHALEQGKDVFAVPGNIDVPTSVGTNSLIQSGAKLVTCGSDILDEYTGLGLFPDVEQRIIDTKSAYKATTDDSGRQAPVYSDPPLFEKKVDTTKIYDKLKSTFTENQLKIILSLVNEPLHLDSIIEVCGLSAARVLAELTVLELEGAVKQMSGKRFSITDMIIQGGF
jgi:DNA processing protein